MRSDKFVLFELDFDIQAVVLKDYASTMNTCTHISRNENNKIKCSNDLFIAVSLVK